MLVLGPAVVGTSPAPVLDDIPLGVERDHRWRRATALGDRRILYETGLVFVQRVRPVDDPDRIMRVDGDTGDLPD